MTLEEAIAEEREAERKLKKARGSLARLEDKRSELMKAEYVARTHVAECKRKVAELMGGQ